MPQVFLRQLNYNYMKTCAITGHRFALLPFKQDENDPRCIQLRRVLREHFTHLIEAEGVDRFLCGMALGSDQIAFEILIQLKHEFPHISLHAYIPCQEQYRKWSATQTARYRAILLHVDEIVCIGEEYTPMCMQKRNHAMVDACDILLAVYTQGTRGGTKATIDYAIKKKRKLYCIDPQNI